MLHKIHSAKKYIKVDRSQIPKASKAKPDFLAPGPRVLIAKEKVRLETADLDDDENASPQIWYPSDKILGKLYRSINEDAFLDDFKNNVKQTKTKATPGQRGVVNQLRHYLSTQTAHLKPDLMEEMEMAQRCYG